MNANFTPSKNTVEHVSSFRHWCQKVLPLVYDDSLSYYELLCKMTTYLNNVIENCNLVGEDVEKLYNAYNQLEGYVNAYFNSLDIQEEVDRKLDTMAKSGTFDNLFLMYLAPFTTQLNDLENKVTSLSPREGSSDVNEVSYARYSCVSGYNSTLSERLYNDTENSVHLNRKNILNEADIVKDKYYNNGVPTTLEGYSYVEIPCTGGDRFIVDNLDATGLNQNHLAYFYDMNNNKLVFSTTNSTISVAYAVTGFGSAPANAVKFVVCFKSDVLPRIYKMEELNSNSASVITNLKQLEWKASVETLSFYINSSTTNAFGLVPTTPSVKEEPYRGCGIYPVTENSEYVIQYFGTRLNSAFLGFYDEAGTMLGRVYDNVLDESGVHYFTTPSGCKYIGVNGVVGTPEPLIHKVSDRTLFKPFKINGVRVDGTKDVTLPINVAVLNKSWVAFGDSVTARNTWQPQLVDLLGITEYTNLGIGSTCIANVGSKPMCSNDRIEGVVNAGADFVTILGGFNDLAYNVPIGSDNDITGYNDSTFLGAYSKIVNAILSAKADTHVIIMGLYPAHNNGADISANRRYSEYNEACKKIADYYGLPFVDLWHTGFNQYTQGSLYSSDDIHPNALFSKRIAGACLPVFNEYVLM